MSQQSIRPVYYRDDEQAFEVRGERPHIRTPSHTRNPDASHALHSRPPLSHSTDSGASSRYHSANSSHREEAPEDASRGPSFVGSRTPNTPQTSSRLRASQTPSTPSLHSAGNGSDEEQGWGMKKFFSPWQRTPGKYNTLVKSQNEISERPASLRPSLGYDLGNQRYRSIEASRESAASSVDSSRRGSFAAGARFSENARNHPYSHNSYGRAGIDFDLESIPGTPLTPPNPTWVYGPRSSSPVASALWLPEHGTGSPGGASVHSMQSMASYSPYVSKHIVPLYFFPANMSLLAKSAVLSTLIPR